MEKKSLDSAMQDLDEKMEDAKDNESFTGNLKALVAKNIPMMCSFDIGGFKYNAWIKGSNVKSEYANPQGTGVVIIKDNCMYTWVQEEKQGMEICMDESEGSIWDQSENLPSEYYCVPSLIMDSTFDLPQDVEFLSLDKMMQMEGLEDYMSQ